MDESRRDFIKQVGKVIAGTAIVSSLDASASESFQNKSEYIYESGDGAEAHKSGNEFANRVGNILKQQYPSRIENPSVRIEVSDQKFKFIWNCNFVKCEERDADYYFDRRGTLLSGANAQIAHNNVEAELRQSGKVQQMMDSFDLKYGGHKMPNSFVSESISQPAGGKVWCVREFFCTAKK
jgi:hypothetical protein